MRALVTGGKGFVGSHLAVRLRDLGYSVVVIDDESVKKKSNYSKWLTSFSV